MSKIAVLELLKSTEDRIKNYIPDQFISKLSEQEAAEFEIIKNDNQSARHPFAPTGIVWEKISKSFEKRLHIDGLGNIEDQTINHWFSAFKPTHKKYYFYCLWLLYSRLKEKDTNGLMDKVSPSASQKNGIAIDVNGKILSWDYLISMESVISMVEHYPDLITKPNVVLDLGAGWGRMGYILKKLNPNITYIIADIPVSLMVSQHYLPKVLPDEKTYKYLDNKNVASFSHEYFLERAGLHFFGSQDLERFEKQSIDFFINIASFQEMTVNQVNAYFEIVNDITRKAIYIEQRYKGDEVTRQDYPYHESWTKLMDRDVVFAPQYFESLYQTNKG